MPTAITLLTTIIRSWDNVEELAAEVSHKKAKLKDNPSATDPLEQFCDENPEADECRVYVSKARYPYLCQRVSNAQR